MWLAVPGRSSLTYDVAVVSSIEYSSREKARPQPPQPIASKQASKHHLFVSRSDNFKLSELA